MRQRIAFLIVVAAALFSAAEYEAGTHRVRKVTSGDTFILEDFRPVKLIGVDAPKEADAEGRNLINAQRINADAGDLQAFAHKSTEQLKKLIEGEKVRLEVDPAFYPIGHEDSYGRLLAYAYRESDGLFLNSDMIRRGFALVDQDFVVKFLSDFEEDAAEAEKKRSGLWKDLNRKKKKE